ncbi:6962_t:CDS:2 [Acaulospora morrowiae]|uniref:6962_t:CDS:1 n=1 Tax=Acaulospora morrowiae TaxID=94023 RepID=A0A9N8W3Y9_9GLOM|nr:6962_t:CDS:2 [Acaulospora morrowiae]
MAADDTLDQQFEGLQLNEKNIFALSENHQFEEIQECHKIFVTRELMIYIFRELPVRTVLKMRLVCHRWDEILQDDYTWKRIFEFKFGKVQNSLFLDDQTYKSTCIFKEFHETRLWSNVISLVNDPASTKLNRFKLFGESALTNNYLYDVVATNVIDIGVAIALVAQRRLVLDEQAGIQTVNERPTISNVDFNLIPNVEIKVYVKLIPFNGHDGYELINCDRQLLTISRNDFFQEGGWIKNSVRIQLGRKYFMYSSDVSMGTCKIFSYYETNSLGNFNVSNPPLKELAISRHFFVTGTEPGNFQLTTHTSSNKHMIRSTDLDERYRFGIVVDDIQINRVDQRTLKGKMSAFHMDFNDLMIVGYCNNEGESVFRVWDLRGARECESFETREHENKISRYEGKLESKAQSFLVRWKDSHGRYKTLLENELKDQLEASPEIIVTCLGGNIAIYEVEKKLKCLWRISTGLTFLKVIDTKFWSPVNFPSNGNWLFLSAKKIVGDMKMPVVLQLRLTTSTKNYDGINLGYLNIDDHNPNKEDGVRKRELLTYRLFIPKILSNASIVQVMPHLPHALIVLLLQREPDFHRPQPRYSLVVYDYHTSNIISKLHSSPFMFMASNGYLVMAPKHTFKDDIVYMPLPKFNYRYKQAAAVLSKQSKPRLQPDGMNTLKVNRGIGKRMKQPKGTKMDKRKNRSSKIQFSVRDYNIEYDECDIGDEEYENLDEYGEHDDEQYDYDDRDEYDEY